MTKILLVSKFTFMEIIKSKILLYVLVLGFFLLLISYLAYSFTIGVPEKVALDFGLGTLSLSSVGMAIFMGVGLVAKEVENRTVYMILSRPIKRSSFLLGKVLGMVSVLGLNILILSLMTLLLYCFLGGKLQGLIFWAIGFSIIEAVLCLLLVTFFSLLTNPTLSVVNTLITFVLGHSINDVLTTTFVKSSPNLKYLIKGYSFFFPNFSKLNIKDFALYQEGLPSAFLGGALLYGLSYCLMLILLSTLIFEWKDLD